jgi:hypothetical protein
MTATTTAAAAEAATIETGRYHVARVSGRYRVLDNGGAILVTVASKAAGQKWIDRKVQDAVDMAEQAVAERDRLAAVRAAKAEDALVAAVNRGDEAGADNARAELAAAEQAPADAREERATELADAVAAGAVSFDAAVSELLGARVETPAAKPVEKMAAAVAAKKAAKDDTVAYRIGKVLREFVLANAAGYAPALVEHIKGRNVCYDGTATLRLTVAWVAELSAAATDLENAALAGEFQAKAPAVMAARAARKGLAKLF